MGAGYPIGAFITRRDMADRLARRYDYFSTFAATRVAAANAVLDVLELEQIPREGAQVGSYLRSQLVELAETPPVLGDIRGVGLIAGVDLTASRDAVANKRYANAVVEKLVQHRILAALTGPTGTRSMSSLR